MKHHAMLLIALTLLSVEIAINTDGAICGIAVIQFIILAILSLFAIGEKKNE